MLKKILSITFIVLLSIICCALFVDYDKSYNVTEVISPINLKLENKDFIFNDLQTFDNFYSENNKLLAKELGITETEGFILGNLGNYWAENFIKGRKVRIKKHSDLIYFKHSYKSKLCHSAFCFKNFEPCSKDAFSKKLLEIRKTRYLILDLDSDKEYMLNDKNVKNLKNFILIKKSHLNKIYNSKYSKSFFENKDIKLFLTDSTSSIRPSKNCSTSLCREIINNINSAQNTIDMALYGYSQVPAIEKALVNAIRRGVKIRLVYDMDTNGRNIYPDTQKLASIIKNCNTDKKSNEARNLMHNKFFIFDDKILITGSANLSYTDMSGFNSNSIIVINSPIISRIYKNEFEQMYFGKYHNDKISKPNKKVQLQNSEINIYFSPQDKSVTNAILPIIKNAKQYIYIPTFVLTERRVTEELIKAKQRGVDVKIIIDALNASIRHSKHVELRNGGLEVKTENYAGKMHSKSMIVDDKYTIIGSMNFSNSGESRNDENLVVIKNSELTKFYKDFFLYQWNRIDNKWLKQNVRAESKDSIGSCYDGIDNNYDGLIDLNDPACR